MSLKLERLQKIDVAFLRAK